MAKAAVVETNEQGTAMQKITAGPERLMQFLKDVRQEMRKVVTPSRMEVQNTTIVVIVTVFIFAAYFALVDQLLGSLIDKLLIHLTK
ncbi:MAG TPA: preprotein translocase subunit SecE [Acidobacteriaceae bacterium]|jgi:preprotein translocase subunit SecE